MTIMSEDGYRFVDVGDYGTWNCFYSTIITRLNGIKDRIGLALSFLETVQCEQGNCIETARQLNLIRDNLSALSVNELVYDHSDLRKKAPWEGDISPIITSCGNFFTTADGKDLIFELTALLCYAAYSQNKIICED